MSVFEPNRESRANGGESARSVVVSSQRLELLVFGEVAASKKQGVALVPEDTRGLVQAALVDVFSQIRPAGAATVAGVVSLVVPPQLKSAKGLATVVADAQHAIGIEKLFDIASIVYTDPFHFQVLPDKWIILSPH